ncbi:MAG: hypothetical protein EOP04_05125 [Proteobacteria bacterium]|nr:MAG: hypothetical protein EOP04_05125 [Pseudomonadota bacterium]
MSYGESLTLKEAAQFAGVSEGTMRTWTKQIEDITRVAGGGYQIPRNSLQAYLSLKNARSRKGATIASTSPSKGKGSGDKQSPLEAQLRAENERLLREATARGLELQSAREELKEALSEIRKLEAEMRAYLSGKGLTGAIARILRSK